MSSRPHPHSSFTTLAGVLLVMLTLPIAIVALMRGDCR